MKQEVQVVDYHREETLIEEDFAPRGRGRGREIWCYTCGEWGHGSWDCPHNKAKNQRNVNVAKAREEKPQIVDKEESAKVG